MRKSRRGKKRQKKKGRGGQIEITSSQKNLVVKTLREKKQSREKKKIVEKRERERQDGKRKSVAKHK